MKLKSKYLVFLIVICILFSLTAVSAADNQTDVLNGNALSEKPTATTIKTYDDLYADMKNSTGIFDMQYDYKYSVNDSVSFLEFNVSSLVINGNGHVIDGSNEVAGLYFLNMDNEITLNDLTFINCNEFAMASAGNVTLNNVNFTGNFIGSSISGSGVVTAGYGNLILNNCNFNSNVDTPLVYVYYGDVAIYNSHFHNSRSNDAPIYIGRNSLVIENCTFENLSSRYGGMLNFKGDYLSVKNSRFKNIHADFSGGAILGKYFPVVASSDVEDISYRPSEDMRIENCEFLNVSSLHNGGALYFDLISGAGNFSKTLHITNCNFTDSSSRFGGIIANQGGFLNVSNTNFINSRASDIGGAIYASWTNLTLTGCSIINNSAGSNAGAIYFDNGRLVIDKSNFTSNKVDAGSSGKESIIYANDVDATIVNSTFKNGGIAVYANFASDSNIRDIDSTDLFLMNNTDYIVSVENNGIRLNLTKNSIVVDTLPSRFDLRDWGWVSPLKYQGDSMACWAFATAAALECSLLRATGVLYNISEENIYDLQVKYYSEGDNRNTAVGFAYSGLGHSLSWQGVVTAQDDPFDERGMFSCVIDTENRIHLQDAMIVFGGRNDTAELLKRAIINYGPVTIHYSILPFDYNRTDYTPEELLPDHFVAVIGWDDDFPAEKFDNERVTDGNPPKRNGAWLIKDSDSWDLSGAEGIATGEGGYIWVPYDNPSFLSYDLYAYIPQYAGVSYIFENTIDYHVNYQTDLTALAGFNGNYTYYSNEFISKYSEMIGAVGTYFNESGIDYSFDVYVNGVKVNSQRGVSEFAGFRTIVLNKYISVKAGDKFRVVFKSNVLPYQAYSRQHYMAGMSFVSADGKSWSDITLENRTVCLKVYTVRDDSKITGNKNIAVDYSGGKYFSVKVVSGDGHAVVGASVKFNINGKTTTVKTDSSGIAKIKITQLPKKYTMTTTYNGKSVKNTVTVKQVLTAYKVTVKKTAKKFTLKAKLKINGKLVKGKIIKFKFNGKTYKVKTNAKGIAQKTLNKKVIKKLRKGKTYVVGVTYLKDTIKTTVKVK